MHLHVSVTDKVHQFSPGLCMAEAVLLAGREPSQVLYVLRTASSAKLLKRSARGEETLSLNQSQ